MKAISNHIPFEFNGSLEMKHKTGYRWIIPFSLFLFLLFYIVIHFSLSSAIGISIFFFEILYFLDALGSRIPFRSIFCILFSLNFLASPALMYNGFESYQPTSYVMQVPESAYFDYAIPAFLFFRFGLFFFNSKFKGEAVSIKDIASAKHIFDISIGFIITGFLASVLLSFISGGIGFILYLMAQLKFAGLFLLILSGKRISVYWFILIFGSVIISSFQNGLFHDLLIWVVFFGVIYSIKLKPSAMTKIAGLVVFLIIAVFINSIKAGWREKNWSGQEAVSIDLLTEVSQDVNNINGGFFTMQNLAPQLNRINQGWILASTMNNVPANVPFAKGAVLMSYLETSFVPEFLDPNKVKVGDHEAFNTYSGHYISESTSMALGSFADGYLNFGLTGGMIFMFAYGMLFNLVLKWLDKYNSRYPYLVVLSIIVFLYPIRADVDLRLIFGYILKSLIFVYIILRFVKYKFQNS